MKFLILLLVFLHPLSGQNIIEDKTSVKILTPFFSEQKTKKLRLENGLEVYLISNPNLDQSGAALIVGAGGWSDPENFGGLAHFVEHALFLGTKKYPDESGFMSFIGAHGGQTNAFTTYGQTAFIFSVDNQAFAEALDRFGHFFIHPLFDPSGLDREKRAVDQEFHMNKDNNSYRNALILSDLAQVGHPFQKFISGNLQTLEEATREDIVRWYEEHYSSDNMKLVILSTLPLDKLEQEAANLFSKVPKRQTNIEIPQTRATGEEYDQNYVYIEPVDSERTLQLIWELPKEFSDMQDSQPDTNICYVLGYEGEGSLLGQLQEENLATKLGCGTLRLTPDTMLFYIEIDLTQQGLKDKELVITRTFQAIKRIQTEGIDQRLFDEIQAVAKIKYQLKHRKSTFEELMVHAQNIANENLQTYPEQTHIPSKYDKQEIDKLARFLTPETLRVHIIAPKVQTGVGYTKQEKWMKTPYTLKKFTKSSLEKWKNVQLHPAITIPKTNPYIPKKLSLVSTPKIVESILPVPQKIVDTDSGQVFVCQDSHFGIPKVFWSITLLSPKIDLSDPESIAFTDLWVQLIKQEVSSILYRAKMAELNVEIARNDNGIELKIEGLGEHADNLLQAVLKEMKNFSPRAPRFATQKEALEREYQNNLTKSSLKRAAETMKRVLYNTWPSDMEKLAALKKSSFENFQVFSRELLSKVYMQGMLYGNQTTEEGKQAAGLALATLGHKSFPKEEHKKLAVIALPESGGPYYIEESGKSVGNSVFLAIEKIPFNFRERASQQILMQAIKDPFFDTLRTKQQTGYIVASYGDEIKRKLFNFFAVQSNTHTTKDLLYRFEQFIESYLQEMGKSTFTQKEFEIVKHAQLQKLKEPPKTVEEMGELLKLLAFDYEADFTWIDKRIEAMKELTYEQAVVLAKDFLGKANKRRIAVLWNGNTDKEGQLAWKKLPGVKTIKRLAKREENEYTPGN